MDKKQRIENLVGVLTDYNYKYYVLNQPVISDYDFDMMLKELESLEKETGYILPESPTQRIGSDIQNEFKTVHRTRVMGSIENCYDMDELIKWAEKFRGEEFVLEPKYDGTSCSIIYKNGHLSIATTRGDGYNGADITENVKTIKNVPLKLMNNSKALLFDIPGEIEIRGEILLPKSELSRINSERERDGLPIFANERNCAAGSIKQLDPKVTASRNLIFKPYFVLCEDRMFTYNWLHNQSDMLKVAYWLGFSKPDFWCCEKPEDLVASVSWFEDNYLNNQDFRMDGCVIKINSFERQIQEGYTQKVPKWAKAFKFKQEEESTILKDIEIQMGMSGQLGFVGILEPVEVDGTIISRATLNNMDFIRSLNLKLGEYVIIKRGGGVIPNVTGVDFEKNVLNNVIGSEIEEPQVCPFCGASLSRIDGDGANLYCVNENCKERNIQKLIYFVRKDCMNIEKVSEKTIRKLYDLGLVKKWQDLYSLTFDVLVENEFGEITARNIIEQISKSRTDVTADKSLLSLGIRMIGKVTSKNVMQYFASIETLMQSTRDDMKNVNGLGDVAGDCLFEYVQNNKNELNDVCKLLPHTYTSDVMIISDKLKGLSLMATGKLNNFTREEIEKSVLENYGKYSSSISKNLDYLIIGEKASSSKIKKAESCGVTVINEENYLKMLQ